MAGIKHIVFILCVLLYFTFVAADENENTSIEKIEENSNQLQILEEEEKEEQLLDGEEINLKKHKNHKHKEHKHKEHKHKKHEKSEHDHIIIKNKTHVENVNITEPATSHQPIKKNDTIVSPGSTARNVTVSDQNQNANQGETNLERAVKQAMNELNKEKKMENRQEETQAQPLTPTTRTEIEIKENKIIGLLRQPETLTTNAAEE